MPTRVIDYDALWSSTKLLKCAAWTRVEYAWLYGLADANGSFEITNMKAIRGRVAVCRPNLNERRLEKIFDEFRKAGLLFVWTDGTRTWGHWTGSDRPGRLPPAAHRTRYKLMAPRVPTKELSEYISGCTPDNIRTGLGVGLGLGLDGVTVRDTDKEPGESRPVEIATSEPPQRIGFSPQLISQRQVNCRDCGGTFPEAAYLRHSCPQQRERLARPK